MLTTRTTLALLLSLLFASAANAHAPSACTAETWQFVGLTSGNHRGDVGVIEQNLRCSVEMPGARICTSKQYAETPGVSGVGNYAWIRAELSMPFSTQAIEYSGRYGSPNGFFCASSGQALILALGKFEFAQCELEAPIACCALMP